MVRGRRWKVTIAAVLIWAGGAADAIAPAAAPSGTVELNPVSIAADDAAACEIERSDVSPPAGAGATVVSFVLVPLHCVS